MGTEITIKAISWGNNGTSTGETQMSLGDEKLDGMQQAHLVAVFSEADTAASEGVEKDSEVTIKATVGEQAYGAVKLTNPTIVK